MSKTITITINTDNAAFQDGLYEYEVHRILTKLARKIAEGCRIDGRIIRDYNGNECGSVVVEDD